MRIRARAQLVYANNGELSDLARTRPDIESGALAEWPGTGDWRVVRRNQFTEVTGPGGLFGNDDPPSDPIWSIGWDHRSLILMLRSGGAWQHFRLPKASHCYDGAHGWNTEWPRIREIGEDDLLDDDARDVLAISRAVFVAGTRRAFDRVRPT